MREPGRRWWQARSYASAYDLELDRIVAQVRASRRGRAGRVVVGLAVGLFCAALVGLLGLGAVNGWPGWLPVLAWGLTMLLAGATGTALFLAAARPPAAAEIAARIARCGVCLSCGYSLDALPLAPDGCAVCPECGAAWRRVPV
jgi:hypothetical protein